MSESACGETSYALVGKCLLVNISQTIFENLSKMKTVDGKRDCQMENLGTPE